MNFIRKYKLIYDQAFPLRNKTGIKAPFKHPWMTSELGPYLGQLKLKTDCT